MKMDDLNTAGMRKRSRLFIASLLMLSMLVVSCGQNEGNKLEIGDSAPPFSLQDLDGNRIQLSDMTGSPVLMRFFLTDCKYCRADTPVFNEFHSRFADQGLKVLYIDSLGIDSQVVKTFARELGILFPVVQDKGGNVSAAYMVRALPQTIVLDPEHRIMAAILGGVSEAELERLLSPYFSGKS